jgi:hypothetical protein
MNRVFPSMKLKDKKWVFLINVLKLDHQIYAPRLDDPSTRAFERCSSDTFQINGPCAYQICYVYLYRTGPDGWKPETVKIYGYNTRAVTFTYNTFIPSDLWYGFNLCQNASSSHQHSSWKWFMYVMLGLILSALMWSCIYLMLLNLPLLLSW